MYGWNNTANALNDKAYAGVGRLNYPSTALPGAYTGNMVNYHLGWTNIAGAITVNPFVIDPERIGVRASPTAAANTNYVCGAVPYTYPDQNSMFLAHYDATQNKVLIPSFYRPWLVPDPTNDPTGVNFLAAYPGNPSGLPVNPNWTNAGGRYFLMRPRPLEHPNFPYPADQFGDVRNLDGSNGGNDSVWIDIGAPVMTAPNGVKYKMLVAPLILPLDGRVNLNVHGNIMALGNVHAGNQGWGPWEVNLSKVLAMNATEWQQLFLGNSPVAPNSGNTTYPRVVGRYGPTGQPQQSAASCAKQRNHFTWLVSN